MQFGRSGQTVLMLHERHSRLLIGVRLPSRAAAPVAEAIAAVLGPLPPEFRQTVTFDNGTEFAHHYELHALGIETFFCDTYSPWQKGGVENAIGRMRWRLPRKTELALLPEGGVCSATPSVQQYASQVPQLPDFGRGPPRPGVALRM